MTVPRLLAINNYFYRRGGAESVFLDQIDLFQAAGWDVVPFAMQHPHNLPSPYADFFVSEIEYGRPAAALTRAGQAAKVIYSLEARQKLQALMRQARPTVAHAHNVYHHISPSIFGAIKAADVPLVMTVHDLKIACPAYKMLRSGRICEQCRDGRIHNVLLNRCVKDSAALSALVLLETMLHRSLGLYKNTLDRLITPSRFYRDKLVEWGWNTNEIAYIPNFIDAKRFIPGSHEGNYFVYAGRLAPEKGLATLVRAAALSRQRLVIAGTGPEKSTLERLACDLDADVTFVGHLAGVALHRLIGEARALILPSEWYENAPVSVLEAYALGRPVIGTAIGGIPELIRPEETGFLVPFADSSALAEKMASVASLPRSARAKLGAAGRVWVERDFSPDAFRASTLGLYASFASHA